MFETTHSHVLSRIEGVIFPKLDKESKKFFRLDVELSRRGRRLKVYYLNKAACDLYMDVMDPYRKYVNIAGGLVKMRELMKVVFPVEDSGSKAVK